MFVSRFHIPPGTSLLVISIQPKVKNAQTVRSYMNLPLMFGIELFISNS